MGKDICGKEVISLMGNPNFGKEDLTRYIYSNHLQSATLELDDSGQVISYEEYHPYGTTAYQATSSRITATAKRYRFSGKERDEESGLYYHGARYYAPWLGRWTAVDPLESEYAPLSPYNYCFNNPVNFTDGSGMGPEEEKVIYGGQLPEVEVRATRLYSPMATPPTTLSVADNTAIWQMNPERLQGDLEASRQAYLNSVMSGGLGGPYASFNPVSDYDMARREEYTRQREFQIREEQNRALDPFAYDMGRSPGVQAGLSLAVPGVGLAQGSAQFYSGLKTGSKTDMVLGAIGVIGGIRSLMAPTTSVPNFVQTKTIHNTEWSIAGPRNLPNKAASNFMGGQYSRVVTKGEISLYRAGEEGAPLGEYFSFEPPKGVLQVRIDKAILPVWPSGNRSVINTGFQIRIPSGTTMYIGEVAPQGGIYLGGTQQIFISQPWNRLGVYPMRNFPLK